MRVCMIAYTFYENDNRVRRYADALVKRGDHVDVVALRNPEFAEQENFHGVNIYHIQARIQNEKHKLLYLAKLLLFLVNSGIFVTKQHLKNPYDVLHIHNVPDFLVFSGLIPKLKGAKVILDIHDIVPEFYASKFKVSKDSLVCKVLMQIEKLSIAFSDHVIISNHIWEQRLLSRSISKEKCSVFLNYPDPVLFYPRKVEREANKLIFLYPGTLAWHQGLDVAIKAFALVRDELESAEMHVYGGGPERRRLELLATELGISRQVVFKGSFPIDEIVDVMARSNIGVVPKRNDSFGGEAFSTKIFEFMSLGVPVIASRTRIDSYYFDKSVIQFFEPGDENDLARCMILLGKNKGLRDGIADRALEFIKQYSWDKKKQAYFELVDGLVRKNGVVKTSGGQATSKLLGVYYLMKPFIPRRLQIQIRRRVASRKSISNRHIWPINEQTSKKPEAWRGWPDDKRFALVLTHDVEGAKGVPNCLRLADLEQDLGYRSSFNFVALDYEISKELMDSLRARGFEIGLHGLYHHGNLFKSRRAFQKQVPRINEFLKKWNAAGFRSPSMYHNLEWICDLDIEYDASTFDTDPFEPQPDSAGTIYPFIISRNGSKSGFVELPYTLPQDHLLYVVMRERTPSIWKQKLDWIAEKGGLALIITHPDYIDFADKRKPVDAYPANYYVEFLQYIKDRYDGQYWHALPKDVARFIRESETAAQSSINGK